MICLFSSVADICRQTCRHLSASLLAFVDKLVYICQQPQVWVCALRASRVFEALSPYCPSVPNPQAALRLPGVRERPPLRGYCGAQSLATFERVWVYALRASRVFEALSPYCPASLIPGLRYACPGLERGRLFEAIAARSPWRPLRGCGYAHSVLRASSRR